MPIQYDCVQLLRHQIIISLNIVCHKIQIRNSEAKKKKRLLHQMHALQMANFKLYFVSKLKF